jgi:protein translocase SecG subunit
MGTLLIVLFILVSVALVLVILVQRPQGGGLASAFGGGGGTDTAFGGRTGDALTVATVAVFAVYLLLAIGLNVFKPGTQRVQTPAAVTETALAGTVERSHDADRGSGERAGTGTRRCGDARARGSRSGTGRCRDARARRARSGTRRGTRARSGPAALNSGVPR